jgi:hypothetical protein
MAISTIGRAFQDRALRSLSYSISSRDQFIVGVHGRTKALFLTLEGLENGHVTALQAPWEMLFFGVPLGHSEDIAHQDLASADALDASRSCSKADRSSAMLACYVIDKPFDLSSL